MTFVQGREVVYVDTTDLSAVEAVLERGAGMLLVETPSNPLLRISDLLALGALCREHGCLFAVDNSLMSPLYQNPVELGADLVVHSATKHLGGHGDLTAGVIVTSRHDLAERIQFLQNAQGSALAPFECWLLLRGMKTLFLRQRQQSETALRVARYLEAHEDVTQVHYPGLLSHPGHELHLRQARGFGSVLSVSLKSRDAVTRLLDETQLFSKTVSFGSVHSSVSEPLQHVAQGRSAGTQEVSSPTPRASLSGYRGRG